MNEDIVLQEVCVSFPQEQGEVLHQVSFTFPAQQTVAIIGESGSGKSVLGKSLVGLLDRAEVSGRILYRGKNLAGMRDGELRAYRGQRIFFLPQDPALALNPALTIGEQLTEALEYHQGVATGTARSQAEAELVRYGFADGPRICRSYAFQLSGGMQQRVLCAMASLLQPEWIIADEPTKGLDPALRYQVFALFRQLTAATRGGFILITHDLRLARRMSQQLLVLKDGCVVESGSTEKIFARPEAAYTQALVAASVWGERRRVPGGPM